MKRGWTQQKCRNSRAGSSINALTPLTFPEIVHLPLSCKVKPNLLVRSGDEIKGITRKSCRSV